MDIFWSNLLNLDYEISYKTLVVLLFFYGKSFDFRLSHIQYHMHPPYHYHEDNWLDEPKPFFIDPHSENSPCITYLALRVRSGNANYVVRSPILAPISCIISSALNFTVAPFFVIVIWKSFSYLFYCTCSINFILAIHLSKQWFLFLLFLYFIRYAMTIY
jgi:hypothetical protein